MGTLRCTLGIEKELRRLSATYHLSIITSNDARAVETFLNNHKLRELFDPIQCSMNIFGKHSVIKEFIKDHALIPAEILYIGDEVRDIEASKKAGIDVMSVAWGLNSKKILLKHHPTFLIEKPEELTSIL